MSIDSDEIEKRINSLIDLGDSGSKAKHAESIFAGATTILTLLYGNNSPQVEHLKLVRKELFKDDSYIDWKQEQLADSTIGILKSVKDDLASGLTNSIQKEVTGEVFGDLITMAKSAIEEGFQDVAAILASAALEDALKRNASLNGLDVEGKDMSNVISALKSKSLLKGPQASVVASYVKVRNKAFHAEWDKLESEEIRSLIAFTEEYIIKNFS